MSSGHQGKSPRGGEICIAQFSDDATDGAGRQRFFHCPERFGCASGADMQDRKGGGIDRACAAMQQSAMFALQPMLGDPQGWRARACHLRRSQRGQDKSDGCSHVAVAGFGDFVNPLNTQPEWKA